jgi:hypothetical protein
VARLNPSTGALLGVTVLPEPYLALATTTRSLWVTNGLGHLYQVVSIGGYGARVHPSRLLGIHDVLAVHGAGSYLWFLVATTRTVMGLNPVTGATVRFKL